MYPFCHHIKHEGKKILIPGCMGTAAMGLDNCTCPHPGVKNKQIRSRMVKITEMKKEIEKLENEIVMIKCR